jgi:prepilin-type N-terminal cleavage/methylation domain-containing protein
MCGNHRVWSGRRGVTLLELVVSMGILSILIALLVPALKRDREEARSVRCLGNLHEIGRAVLVYAHGSEDMLPGPINPLLHRGVSEPQIKAQLSAITSTGGTDEIQLFDKVATCPTVELMTARSENPRTRQMANYIANTGAFPRPDLPNVVQTQPEDPPCVSQRPGLALTRYVTEPPNYFGYANGRDAVPSPSSVVDELRGPKSLSMINNASSEWMIADLWAWDVFACDRTYPVGTWPLALNSPASSELRDGQELLVPTAPFHKSVQEFLDRAAPIAPMNCKRCCPSNCGPTCACRRDDRERLEAGVTNAVYFDGHADSVANWRGTANPKEGVQSCQP